MLDDIRKEVESLVVKQSWIRKGFVALFNRMDKATPSFDGNHSAMLCEGDYDNPPLSLDLIDGKWWVREGYPVKIFAGGKLEWDRISENVVSIRRCLPHLVYAIGEILDKMKKSNKQAQDVVDKLSELLQRMTDF